MERRRRILITNFHLGTGGGHRTYILSLLKGSLADLFEFAVACPASSSIHSLSRQNASAVFDLSFPGGVTKLPATLRSIRKLDRIYRQFPFEILHCNGSRDHWIGLFWKALFRRKTKIVRTRHAVKGIKNDFVHEFAFNRATALNIYVSRLMIALSEAPGKLKLKRTAIIPNGVDTACFQPQERDAGLAAKFGLSTDDLVIGTNGGLGSHKRVDLMLKAVAALPERKNIKILLMGEERSAPGYLKIARNLGLSENVLYGGMQVDVRPFLSLIDLGFILSEKIETSSYAAKEMMAMGIPLICTRYSGLPENIDEGLNGYLIQPGDMGELTDCLVHFQSLSISERKKMGLHSREKVVREFDQTRQMTSIMQAYDQVLSS